MVCCTARAGEAHWVNQALAGRRISRPILATRGHVQLSFIMAPWPGKVSCVRGRMGSLTLAFAPVLVGPAVLALILALSLASAVPFALAYAFPLALALAGPEFFNIKLFCFLFSLVRSRAAFFELRRFTRTLGQFVQRIILRALQNRVCTH